MRRFALFGLWVAGTLVSAMLAWSAVQVAGVGATFEVAEPLSASEVDALSANAGVAADGLGTRPRGSGGDPPATQPTTTAGAGPADTSVTTPPATAPAATTATSQAGGTTTTVQVTITTAPPASTTTTTASSTSETLVYSLTGGSVGVTYDGDRLAFAWATPSPGFLTEVESEGPDQVVVEFNSSSHESTLAVTLEDDGPRAEQEEEPK